MRWVVALNYDLGTVVKLQPACGARQGLDPENAVQVWWVPYETHQVNSNMSMALGQTYAGSCSRDNKSVARITPSSEGGSS